MGTYTKEKIATLGPVFNYYEIGLIFSISWPILIVIGYPQQKTGDGEMIN